ncbi:unnamed protein product (macronuclear) [Paramecium tetraurelia]|uniref:Uncharacterized protein n=1 Tax=Paramecium tetraurelia TaxID=5888 RepID=A0EDS3_PARTE|nr:uncharacterized protein GSPATT00025784001 [Paramecium tetraurelia]CAK93440.1 unnamed protein product [Paramecium tetraurelia]|eukprot:XP_001460837.1 hypothetical protein (macronuclear) [Paramecium tetraurelia strain d4-2]
MPSILKFPTEPNRQISYSTKDLDSTKHYDQIQLQNSKSYLIGSHYFQPTLKVINGQKPQLFINQKSNLQNQSFLDLSNVESLGSPFSKREDKIDDGFTNFRGREKSLKPQLSPYLTNQQSFSTINNLQSQRKILENALDDSRFQVCKQKKIDQSPQFQIAKNGYFHNFQQIKNLKHLIPFQIEKSVKEKPIQKQKEQVFSSRSPEKSLTYPLKKPLVRSKETQEKIKNKLQRKKSIHLPQISNNEDTINRKLKCFLRTLFENQCMHMIYVRPSAIRIQRYLIKDAKHEELVKRCFSYRWWWQESNNQDEDIEFFWYSQASLSFLSKQGQRHISDKIEFQPFEQVLKKSQGVEDQMRYAIENKLNFLSPQIKVHNHIDLSQPLWTKKNLICSIIKYCQLTRQYVENFVPLSMVVDYLGENLLYAFLKNFKTSTNVWLLRKSDLQEEDKIIVCQNTQSVFNYLNEQFKMPNRNQQSFIVQQYIHPIEFEEIELDLCYYLLITQINGIVRGYLFQQFYGQKSSITISEFEDGSSIYFIENSNSKINNQYISMKNILDHLYLYNFDYESTIYPIIKQILGEYLKSIFIQMPVKDHNFELIKVVMLIDNKGKPCLISTKPNPILEQDVEFMKDFTSQLIDNVFQLGLDLLFPPPSIWPKEKKRLIENYWETNDFELVFDSRIDGQGLKSLSEEILYENYNDDEL